MSMTEKLKNLMEKVEPWQWAAGVGVAVLGVYAYYKNKNNTTEYTEVPQATGSNVGSNTASYGDFQNLTEATASLLQDQNAKIEEISGKIVSRDDSLNQAIEAQNQKIAQTQQSIQAQADTFNQSFNNAVSNFNSAIANTNKVVQETSRSFETQIKQTSSSSSVASPVISSAPAAVSVNSPVVASVASTPTKTTSTPAATTPAKTLNLGNNGVGYNAAVSNTFESSLKTNTSAYNAEMARVNQVIADRKSVGLDTSVQEAYKKKIQQ